MSTIAENLPVTPALAVALEELAARVATAAQGGHPLTKRAAVTWLHATGIPRDDARRLVATASDGRWIVTRGQTTPRGGRPVWVLLPVGTPVCGDLTAATTYPEARADRVDLRVRLLAAARTAHFPKVELRTQVVLMDGEFHWQRFTALASLAEIATALRALGVAVDAGDATP